MARLDPSVSRRERLRRGEVDTTGPGANGIDHVEVVPPGAFPGDRTRRTLLVRCLASVEGLTGSDVRIEGGARVAEVGVEWAHAASEIPDGLPSSAAEAETYARLYAPEKVLVVRADADGDASLYRLVVSPRQAARRFDPWLEKVDFTFRPDCPSELDCRAAPTAPPPVHDEPGIDYLAKDFDSFRRLMLDRLAVLLPEWTERNPADLGVTLVELLASVGDDLGYHQDAAATEAYLGTARRRSSIRRHAKLLDYVLHDGCAARAFVCVELGDDGPDSVTLPPGTPLLTGAGPNVLSSDEWRELEDADVVAFESMPLGGDPAGQVLRRAHSTLRIHTWGEDDFTLPAGATRAAFVDAPAGTLALAPGDLLVLEEIRGAETGRDVDADPARRHVVRLVTVSTGTDPLAGVGGPVPIVEVEWSEEDALLLPLRVRARLGDGAGERVEELVVARGNVVLVDHGRAVDEADSDSSKLADSLVDPPVVPPGERFRPRLLEGPITRTAPLPPEGAPAAELARPDPRRAVPALRLAGSDGSRWTAAPDLLASDASSPEFVVETEEDGEATLRFGDGVHGARPHEGVRFRASLRVGNGTAGNVGAEAIRRVVLDGLSETVRVRNPLPATGGADPESLEEARQFAPAAFRTQERAVTEDDHARMAERLPEVSRAATTFRWTGSWHTAFTTIDRRAGRPVDERFRESVERHLDGYRLAGVDVRVDAPRFVPLDLALDVCVDPVRFRGDVRRELDAVFGRLDLPDGRRGFFHPDAWTFGEPVHLSRIYAAAMSVPGVASVHVSRLERLGAGPNGELEAGVLEVGRLEIVRADNDPDFPNRGRVAFRLEGGR